MSGIIYDARLIKAFERLQELGEYTGESQEWIDELWQNLVQDEAMIKEFIYYLDNHSILDEVKVSGYGLSDMYFYQMRRFNLFHDTGKNNADCDKERLMLHTFQAMLDMKKHPEEYVAKFDDGMGMDQFI